MKKTKLLTSLAALALVLGLGACEQAEDNGAAGSTGEDTASSDTGTSNDSEGGDNEDTSDGTPSEHTHEYEVTDHKDATCTEDGYDVYTCSCGETYTDTIDALGHDWGEWEETKPAACETAGEETRTCSRCQTTETRATDALEHNYVDFYDAEGHWSECTICGATTEKVAHEFTYTAATNEHYHIATCDCGYSCEDLHQLPDDTATACACGAEISCAEYNYSYDSTRGGYLITGYVIESGAKETEYLPAYHDGDNGYLPVVGTSNGGQMSHAFYQWPETTTFYGIPDTFQVLGNYSFYSMSWVKDVAFSENSQLEKIGDYCFAGDDEEGAGIHTLVLTSENVELGTRALADVSSRPNDPFSIVLGPQGSIGSNAFYDVYVNFFYRGTSDDKAANGITTTGNAENATWYYEGQWELVNHVPTVIS